MSEQPISPNSFGFLWLVAAMAGLAAAIVVPAVAATSLAGADASLALPAITAEPASTMRIVLAGRALGAQVSAWPDGVALLLAGSVLLGLAAAVRRTA